MIEVRKLVKWYGPVLALDRIDLNVGKGQVVGFLGPNGAGKSTALRILTCFMPATSGEAKVNGHDVFTDSEEVRQAIGYLPENTPLYPEMRVEEQLHFFGRLHGMDRAARVNRINELSDRCGLTKIRRRLIGQLSKGNKQRVGLAQALLHDPPVLVLDEPTIGLDPGQMTAVRDLIVSFGQEKTVLLSTHILPEVERTCQQVVIIAAGRIAAEGTPDQLKAKVRTGSRVLLELKANPVNVQKALGELPEVSKVDAEVRDEWCLAAVTPAQADRDIREPLGQAVAQHQWVLREMRPETGTLEEFFVQVTSDAAAATAAESAA